MMKTLRASLGAAVAVLAVAGCDAASPPAGAPPDRAARDSGSPGGAITAALRDKDPFARARLLGALLPTLGADAVPEAEQALRNPTLERGATEYELLVRFWASHAPEAATRWAADSSPLFCRSALVLTALPMWVAADLQASLVAVQEWQRFRPDVRE